MELNEIESYFKERLREKYQADGDSLETIVYYNIVNAMLNEYSQKISKYASYDDKEQLYNDILKHIEPKYVTDDGNGGMTFHSPENRYIPEERYRKPNRMKYSVDIISNKIFYNQNNDIKNNDEVITHNLDVSRKDSDKKVNLICTIDYSSLSQKNKEELEQLKVFDRAILDVINTVFLYGNNYVTYNNIFRIICGDDTKKLKDNKNMEMAISRSISKLRNTDITINNSDEAKFFGVDKIYIKRHLLEAYETLVIDSGNETKGIVFTDVPILLGYADARKQIDSSFYTTMMNTPLKKTVPNVSLQNYLARRVIMILRNPVSNKISIDRMMNELGIIENNKKETSTQRVKKTNTIKTSKKILEYWKEKGIIEDYDTEGDKPIKNIVIIKNQKNTDNKRKKSQKTGRG